VEGRDPREELVSIRVELLLLMALVRRGRWWKRVYVRLSARLVSKIVISRWQGNILTVTLGCHVHFCRDSPLLKLQIGANKRHVQTVEGDVLD